MKRKIFILLVALLLSCSLTGCSTEQGIAINTNSEELSSNRFGTFTAISNDFYYDNATLIVYRHYDIYGGHVEVPYYATNGLPYRYNPTTNTLEEIEENGYEL